MSIQAKEVAARNQQIVNMRKNGSTYQDIAFKSGISSERVRQILNRRVRTTRLNSRTSQSLTVSDVADILNIHVNTVRRWSNNGILKTSRIGPRGDRRFDQKYINNLLQKKNVSK